MPNYHILIPGEKQFMVTAKDEPEARALARRIVSRQKEHRCRRLPNGTQVWEDPTSSAKEPDLLERITRSCKLRFRAIWRMADTDYAGARERAFRECNVIRQKYGLPAYTAAKFDEGWQYRNIFAFTYATGVDEFINLVYGWW